MRIERMLVLLSAGMLLGIPAAASADPCGMVPPIYPGGQPVPLARIGEQRTYVFYKDGIETFVIRPGFTGKVEEFGMLIPFPTPPAIRKVPDRVFQHVAAAVDPPEVLVDLRPRFSGAMFGGGGGGFEMDAADSFGIVKDRSQVKVLREEAVGMYEVAVLAAGSAAALKRWMDEHGYKYPDGMDKPCNDYVEVGWCFVAVKTKVSEKKAVDPKPGQRAVRAKLSAGSAFDGHVQGMGFRFKVDELVVPMRLSAFNKGELRNIVYLLTDEPKKIRMIPEEYVVRQINGDRLMRNITAPLPIRVLGGTPSDIPASRRKLLVAERDPGPRNGVAKELFASDLLAVRTGQLALPHEQQEKELLQIGERLGLRGPDIDKINELALAETRRKIVGESLEDLKKMTLTVIDGDFPRELLAQRNLTFSRYTMPARRNKPSAYDAKLKGPAPKQPGILHLGSFDSDRRTVEDRAVAASVGTRHVGSLAIVSILFSIIMIGFVRYHRKRDNR